MGQATGNPEWKDYPDESTPVTAQALNNIEDALDGIGGGGGGMPPLVSAAFYGPSGGYGWALHNFGWHDPIQTTGTHNNGYVISAATAGSRAGYRQRYERYHIGTVVVVRWRFRTPADSRNWVGYNLGDEDAAIPWSDAYNASRGLAIRASSFDGDTTFKVLVNTTLYDTGIPLDDALHTVYARKMTATQWEIKMDGIFSDEFDTGDQNTNFVPNITSIAKTNSAVRVDLDSIWMTRPMPGVLYV